jgi:outer membrane protein assembly factor BamB
VPPVGKRKSLVFKEELSIGQKEGDENYMFGSTVFFNTDEEGNFYVTDWDMKRILKYDPAGKYVLTIGHKGQGPGEFQGPSVARFDKEGSIYVTDLANRRISFFSQRGEFLRQIPVPDFFEDLYITARGSYVSNHTAPIKSDAGQAFKVVDGIFNGEFELMTAFNARNVVYKLPAGTDSTAWANYFAGLVSRAAFQPVPRHVLALDGTIYFGYPKDDVIDVYTPEGRKAKTVKREYTPIRVKDKDKDYLAVTMVRPTLARVGRPTSESEIQNILKLIEYPENKPAYQSFSLMENGWLVVLVEFAAGEYSLFDILDENGLYIGQFKANNPAEYGFLFFKDGKAYAVETDEEGYKYIKRYSVKVEDY